MSLRDPPVSGEFLAHLAHFVLEAFVCLSDLLCVPQQFLFFQTNCLFNDIFLTYFHQKGIFIKLLSRMMDEYI